MRLELFAPIRTAFERRDFSLRDPALWRLFGNNVGTAAGVSISEDTALNIAAYWRGVQVISGDMASMPLIHYKRDQKGGKTEFSGSKLYKLLHDQPNPEMTAFSWREQLQAHLLTWGNAYSEIEWNNLEQPIGLWPITPDRVVVFRDTLDRRIKYRVSRSGGPDRVVDRDDMLHIPGLGFDGLVGYSVIGRARQSLGLMAASERYGATFFGNGANVSGILSTDDDLDDTQKNEVRDEINRVHQGPDRAHRLMVLSGGQFKYERMSMPPNDAQFLETRRFQVTEMARWLGVPPHKIYDLERSTNNNIEHQGLEYYADTIWHWCERWEQEINRKLIPSLERTQQFVEFKIQGILRADINTRYTAYNVGHTGGWLSVDEIRELENMNPLPGGVGAVYLAPLSMMPADRYGKYWDDKLKPKPEPAPPAQAVPGGADPTTKQLQQDAQDAKTRADRAEQAATEARAEAQRAIDHVRELEAAATVNLDEVKTARGEAAATRAHAEQIIALSNEAKRDAEQLRAQLETTTQAAAVAESRSIALAADRDRLAAELAEAQTTAESRVAATSEQLARAQTALRQQVQDVERLRREAMAARQTADREHRQALLGAAERDAAIARAEEAAAARAHADAELVAMGVASSRSEQQAQALSSDIEAARAELQVLQESRSTDDSARTAAEAMCAALDKQLQAATAAAEMASAREAEFVAARDLTDAALQAAEIERQRLEAESAERTAALDVAMRDRTAVESARDDAIVLCAELDGQVAELRSLVEQSQHERDAAKIAVAAALAQAEDERVAHAAAVAERDDEAIARQTQLEIDIASARQIAETAQRELEVAIAAGEAAKQSRNAAVAAAEADRIARVAADEAHRSAVAERDRLDAEAIERHQRAETLERSADMLRRQLHDATVAEITAHRTLYLSTMRRMVERETERLRRAQHSPEKLRATIETFYDGFEDLVTKALHDGVVQTHLTFVRSTDDSLAVARRLAREHVSESQRQLALMVDRTADDNFAGSLTSLWYRWETERVNTVADLLMQKELEYARLA